MSEPVTATLALTNTGSVSSTFYAVGPAFVIEARTAAGTPVTRFSHTFTITVRYTDAEVTGKDESSLKVYYWDTAASAWVALPTVVDIDANTLTATLDHLTRFAVLGQQKRKVYLPLILKNR